MTLAFKYFLKDLIMVVSSVLYQPSLLCNFFLSDQIVYQHRSNSKTAFQTPIYIAEI